MIFPQENASAIRIIDVAYKYANALGGNKSLAVRCRGLVEADRLLAHFDQHPEIEARQALSDRYAIHFCGKE